MATGKSCRKWTAGGRGKTDKDGRNHHILALIRIRHKPSICDLNILHHDK